MPAVPRNPEAPLARLEAARHLRPGAREAEPRIRAAARIDARDASDLIRLHEAVLFLRAYPHDERVLRAAERLLDSFDRRIERLSRSGDDLSAFDAPEVAGVAGTVIGTDFSWDLVRWLLRRHPNDVRVDWEACDAYERMRAT